jgi:hypothetical protein
MSSRHNPFKVLLPFMRLKPKPIKTKKCMTVDEKAKNDSSQFFLCFGSSNQLLTLRVLSTPKRHVPAA